MSSLDPNLYINLETLLGLLKTFDKNVESSNVWKAITAATEYIDPKTSLSGLWTLLHIKAEEADKESKRLEYIQFLYWFAKIFWCETCAPEFRQYLKDHPPEKSFYMGKYMFDCHNKVNSRVGKPLMAEETYNATYKSNLLKVPDGNNNTTAKSDTPQPCIGCAKGGNLATPPLNGKIANYQPMVPNTGFQLNHLF